LAEQLGLAVVEMAQKKTYPVVVRTEIDYRRSATLGDRLVIEAWLDRAERARFWCAFRITRPKDNTLIADCRQMLALIEMPSAKLLRLPEHWKTYGGIESTERSEHESRAGSGPSGEGVQ
jgi:acyl-CoA thioesterase FadM